MPIRGGVETERVTLPGHVSWTTVEAPTFPGDHFLNFSHQNTASPADAGEIFRRTFEGHVAKGGLLPRDVSLFEYGVQFYSLSGEIPEKAIAEISRELADRGLDARIMLVQEPNGFDSVQVRFGSKDEALSMHEIEAGLEDRANALEWVYDALELWGLDIDWAVLFETDEELYAKGK